MEPVNKKQIIIINTLLSEIGKRRGFKFEKEEKAELILSYTKGRAGSTSGLFKTQAQAMIVELNKMLDKPTEKAGELQRRHIIAMAHEMQWQLPGGKIDMKRLNGWCVEFGYLHKPLNDYEYDQLPKLVSQFKNVLKSFLKSI